MQNLEPIDVAIRIYRRKPYWATSPEIKLSGDNKNFGTLEFIFHERWGDDILKYIIWIHDKDKVLQIAQNSIDNFRELVNFYYEN